MPGITRSIFGPLAAFALSAALGLATSLAYADELLSPPSSGVKIPFSLGAAIVYKEKPYRNYDNDEKVQLAPLIVYQGDHFYFRGANFGWMFVNRPNMELAVVGEIRTDGYDSGDANILQGMDDRDPTLDGGARFTWRPNGGPWALNLVAVHDLTDEYDGYELRADGSYAWKPNDNWAVRFGAGVVQQSDDLVDYYFGVKPSEARPGRPAYSGDDTTNVRLQTIASWRPDGSRFTYIFGGRYEFLGDEIDDSPLVDEDTRWRAVAGFTYTFKSNK
jgi:outer membrane protein